MGNGDILMKKYREVIEEIQKEWQEYPDTHNDLHYRNRQGIRSSQISALVMFLIKKGIIK